MIYRFQIYIYFVNYFKNHGVMLERRSGEVAVPLSAKKNFKRVVPKDMQTAVKRYSIIRVCMREYTPPNIDLDIERGYSAMSTHSTILALGCTKFAS